MREPALIDRLTQPARASLGGALGATLPERIPPVAFGVLTEILAEGRAERFADRIADRLSKTLAEELTAVGLRLAGSRRLDEVLWLRGECWKDRGRPAPAPFVNARAWSGWGPAERCLGRGIRIALRIGIGPDPPRVPRPQLGIDRTGVGHPVVDLFRRARIAAEPVPIPMTAGPEVVRDDPAYQVPKPVLVSTLQVLLQARRLQVASGLPEAATLTRELLNFKAKVTLIVSDRSEALDWREGVHDALVLAVAMAVWLGEQPRGRLRIYNYLRGEWVYGEPTEDTG